MRDGACIGPRVDVYNVGHITIGKDALISQDSFICTASHDFRHPSFPLKVASITIEDRAWVCARTIILPGVTVASRSIIGTGCVASQSTQEGKVYAGNPMREVGSV